MPTDHRAQSCPSAQPDMEGARVFGVISGTPEAPRIAYLKESAPIDPAAVELGGVPPTQVFRFAARCEQSRCLHFDGQRCGLAQRIAQQLDAVVDTLPPCLIRPTCRWFAEQGEQVCRRCPQVVTMIPMGDDPLSRAALPDPGAPAAGGAAAVEGDRG